MPRGVKGSVDYNAKLQELEQKIEKIESRLAGLKAQRKEIEAVKQEAELLDLRKYMEANSLTADDIIEKLSPSQSIAAASEPPLQII